MGCASQKSKRPERPATHLTETEALSIAKGFVDEKQWIMVEAPTKASFEVNEGDWRINFTTKRHRYVDVYVNDSTKKVRYVVGE